VLLCKLTNVLYLYEFFRTALARYESGLGPCPTVSFGIRDLEHSASAPRHYSETIWIIPLGDLNAGGKVIWKINGHLGNRHTECVNVNYIWLWQDSAKHVARSTTNTATKERISQGISGPLHLYTCVEINNCMSFSVPDIRMVGISTGNAEMHNYYVVNVNKWDSHLITLQLVPAWNIICSHAALL
jgi:hypothetical protein